MQHQDLSREKLLKAELENLRDEGCQNTELLIEIEKALQMGANPSMDESLWHRIGAVNAHLLESKKEPSRLDRIRGQRRSFFNFTFKEKKGFDWYDQVYGAWLARCAGCTLGKPVEGWSRERIAAYLKAAGAYPLHSYIPAMDPFPAGLELWKNYNGTTLGNIQRMVRDDDTDYTVIGLKTLETYGRDFQPGDIGKIWLANLPYGSIFTAETIAYRNMVNEMDPPYTASYRNPYREYIGAQIRGDMWGYVNPGNPERAAEMAFRDACISHTKNGIYGEMWAAACIAAAFVLDDPLEIILTGLNYIPAESRLTQAILKTMQWVAESPSWEGVRDNIEREYAGMSSIHVINNTCLIVLGLLLGQGELGETLCITLMGGMDTDCTCATAGSMMGAMHGARALPAEWTMPLNDELQSSISENEICRISYLARRTCRMMSM
jgi:ADP-ribosylglycohydrolase